MGALHDHVTPCRQTVPHLNHFKAYVVSAHV